MMDYQMSLFPGAVALGHGVEDMRLIYEPRGLAREYARYALNVYRGCDHGCRYCYVPGGFRIQPDEFHMPRTRDMLRLDVLRRDAEILAAFDQGAHVLLCFTCDPYQRFDDAWMVTRHVIEVLKRSGACVNVLTKGGTRALRDLDLLDARDRFGTTLTCLDQRWQDWEPGARDPQDRIEAMRAMSAAGLHTWVSLEPVIFPQQTLEIISQTHEFTDEYLVGKLNYHPRAQAIDWERFAFQVVERLDELGARYRLKSSLSRYLAGEVGHDSA